MANLHTFYDNPTENARQLKMWFIQFLLVLAFGKAFLQPAMTSGIPPGSEYFLRAMNMIPDTERLYREPVPAIEVLCMVSLYLQSVDMRCSAYGYVRLSAIPSR
jgi:proline utilization trans-activator